MDAIVFGILTICLTICTVMLFIRLRVMSLQSRKDKNVMGAVAALFTFSYLARSVYLMYEVINEDSFVDDCTLEYENAIFFLSLLPVFDVFPCVTVLLFDTIRLCCGSAQQ
mmetsp:Transcript_37145/g.48848  ORF Transcript_37145/g.48848 Transcript_37145/m.48848 type:complete len:111 (-) Transcript_37145:326-658(-)